MQPQGTETIEAEVRNLSAEQLTPTVTTDTGLLQGAAQPATVPPNSTTNVRFAVPTVEPWKIVIAPGEWISKADYDRFGRPGCKLFFEEGADGSFSYGCQG